MEDDINSVEQQLRDLNLNYIYTDAPNFEETDELSVFSNFARDVRAPVSLNTSTIFGFN